MGLGILAIAKGAFNIGQKIFGGIKKRQERKIEKRANQLVERERKLAEADAFFGGSTLPIRTPGIVQEANTEKVGLFGRIQSLINPEAGTQAISSAANNLLLAKGGNLENPVASNAAIAERENNGPGKVNPMLLIGGAFILILLFISKKR